MKGNLPRAPKNATHQLAAIIMTTNFYSVQVANIKLADTKNGINVTSLVGKNRTEKNYTKLLYAWLP